MNGTMQDLIDELKRQAEDLKDLINVSVFDLSATLDDLAARMEARNASLNEQLAKLADARAEAVDEAAALRQGFEVVMNITTPGEKEWLSAAELVNMVHCDATKMLSSNEIGKALRADVREIERMVRAFEDAEHNHYRMYGEPLSKRVQVLVSFYQRTAATALSNDKAFRDDMLTWLRSFSMVVEMAGNAGTHAEKNARFRGLVELLESAAHKLQNTRVEFGYRWYDHVDVFKTDYPVRHFVEKIHELERENKELKASAQPVEAE